MVYFTLFFASSALDYLAKAGMFSLHLLFSLAFTYALVSLVEYFSHRYLQHTRVIAKIFPRIALLEKIFIDHAKVHHHEAYDVFNDEPNLRLRMYNLVIKYRTTAAVMIVLGLPLYAVDHLTAIVFWAVAVGHNLVWTRVHIEMHVNEGHFIRKAPFFKYCEEYHFVHHLYPGKNFNGLFPLWDWICGTFTRTDKNDFAALEATRRLEAISRRTFLKAKYARRQIKSAQA
jgi:Fatty acid hydroxylase superfamily